MTNEAKSWKDEKEKNQPAAKTAAAAKKQAEAAEQPVAAAASPAATQPAAKPVPAKPVAATPAAPLVGRQQVEVDDSDVNVCYANFCRVTGTPEEIIIDFGLNTQPYGVPTKPIKVRDRVVTNMYTAKRMLQALHMTIQRHESAFGVLETDVQKRVIAAPPQR